MFNPKGKSFDKDSLQTPKYIFDYLNSLYQFDYDLCASDEYHLCEQYFTKETSHLDLPPSLFFKAGETGFCNPPYSNIDPFINWSIEASKKGFTTVFLIPELNGEQRTGLIMANATRIIHLVPRISFIRPDNGEEYKGNNRGSIIVEFSKKYGSAMARHEFLDLRTIQ